MTKKKIILLQAEVNCLTGEQITRPYTDEETAAWYADKAQEQDNAPTVATDPLEELRQQIAALQALVASLTKAVQTTP